MNLLCNLQRSFLLWYWSMIFTNLLWYFSSTPLITRFMGPTWGQSGADRTQVGPMLAPVNIAIWDSLYHSAYLDEILHCIRVYPYSPKATMVLCHIRETKMVQKINRSLWTQISIYGYFCLNRVTVNYDQCPCYGHWLRKMGSCT